LFKKTVLHRIVIISKLTNNFSDKTKIGEYYDQMVRNQQKQQQNQSRLPDTFRDRITGILIIYPTIMIHIIESSFQTINDILIDIQQMTADEETTMIGETRILNYSHEIQVRLFPIYIYKMMNLNSEHNVSDPSESIETLINDILVRLLRLGKFLNDKNSLKKETIDNLHEQHPEFMPNQSKLFSSLNLIIKNTKINY
jgi:hypothetical protein